MGAGEMLVSILGIIAWSVVILKFIDAWSNKKHYELAQAAKDDMLAINNQLKQVVEANTEALLLISEMYHKNITQTDTRLEAVLDKSRQLNIMDVRILEIVRTIRKLDSMEVQLHEAVKNSRRIPYLESILNK
jgi:hypothetical protein